jgi:hypothetical protein
VESNGVVVGDDDDDYFVTDVHKRFLMTAATHTKDRLLRFVPLLDLLCRSHDVI